MVRAKQRQPRTTTFAQVYAVMKTNCATCHSGQNGGLKNGKLDLSTQNAAYTNLVGVMAMGTKCGTTKESRVLKNSSATSLLYSKVKGTQDCGVQMPDGQNALGASDIALVQTWIDEGAPNN